MLVMHENSNIVHVSKQAYWLSTAASLYHNDNQHCVYNPHTNPLPQLAIAWNQATKIESTNIPKCVVLRFHIQHELEEAPINKRCFALHGHDRSHTNFFSHLMAPNESSKMHIVLDLNCKSYPTIDNDKIEYEVFKVTKEKNNLYAIPSLSEYQTKPCASEFEKLNSSACDFARARCTRVIWGANRIQSKELDNNCALHGKAPATFVSWA